MSLSVPRRFVGDLLHVSRNIPIVTFERQANLAALVQARKRLAQPPAWSVIVAKAFARVASTRPELRRTYLSWPWPHLWEADESVAAVAVEREYRGESGVFFGMLRSPEKQPLVELNDIVREWKTLPVEEVRPFHRIIRYSRWPLPLRRTLWWYVTAWSGKAKVKNLGTFGVSLTGSAGATATNLIGPLAASLNMGVIGTDGRVDLRLHFDHRVLDGMAAARALTELEEVLCTEVVEEIERGSKGSSS
jgi:hypothetical protein